MKYKPGDKVIPRLNRVTGEDKLDVCYNPITKKLFEREQTVLQGMVGRGYTTDKSDGWVLLEHWLELVDQVKTTETHDMVNKPKHYMLFPDKGIEVIDVVDVLMEKAAKVLNPKQLGYYTHLLGYLFRFAEKNGEEDLKKAKFYLDRIIEKK